MRHVRVALTGLALCSLAALAACGNGVPTTSSSSSTGGCGDGSAGVSLGSAAVKIAATDGPAFAPVTATASVGQVVQWSDNGTLPHTITFSGADSCLSDSQINPGGGTWEIKFTKPGTYPYVCQIHPGMHGTITVS